jgi:hypothetical protein
MQTILTSWVEQPGGGLCIAESDVIGIGKDPNNFDIRRHGLGDFREVASGARNPHADSEIEFLPKLDFADFFPPASDAAERVNDFETAGV